MIEKVYDIPPNFCGEEWAGEYKVIQISGAEYVEIGDESINELTDRGIPIEQAVDKFDPKIFNTKLLEKSVLKNKEKIRVNLKEMPSKLYSLLMTASRELNEVSPDEQRFLLRK